MKVLLIPLDFQRHHEDYKLFCDMVSGFDKAGHHPLLYSNIEEAISFKPDIIMYQGSLKKEELVLLKYQTGAKVGMWTGDCRYTPPQSLSDMKGIVDLYLLPFSGPLLEIYSKLLETNCAFLWEPIHEWKFINPDLYNTKDISFVGNHYETLPGGESRIDILTHIKKHVSSVKVYGNIQIEGAKPISYLEVPDLYNKSYAVIAENNMHDVEFYFTPRNLGGMAAGSCTLMRRFPGIEKLFSDFEDCIIYNHKYDLLEKIHFIRHNPSIRNKIAQKAHKSAERFNYWAWARHFCNSMQ